MKLRSAAPLFAHSDVSVHVHAAAQKTLTVNKYLASFTAVSRKIHPAVIDVER